MTDLQTALDRPYGQTPEAIAAALSYLQRTGNADVAVVLGLVDDPVANERNRAKAAGQLHGKGPTPPPRTPRPGFCPICDNKLPGHGVCRRSTACREAAHERGDGASPHRCSVHNVRLRWGKCSKCDSNGSTP